MKIDYFPGCTLSTKARSLDQTAREALKVFGVELVELPNWICCGASFPLTGDNLIGLVPPTRILLSAKNDLTTICSFCYNTLKRTDRLMRENPEKRRRVSLFLDLDGEYREVKVFHLLEILKEKIGFEKIREKASPLNIKVAPYYGCMLLRPREIKIDDPENPRILEDFLSSIGCEAVSFPHRSECCGSYLIVSDQKIAGGCSELILNSAISNGAEALAVTCPVCHFSMGERRKIPVFYFTELLALSLNIEVDFSHHFVSPLPLLEKRIR
jgi:heterodisulfide reductase subunit B